MNVESAIPAHLRQFVVRQDYEQYTEEDQAVWRFVVLQTHARLLRTAHQAYGAGFEAAGISVDRIPRIEEMAERMARFGWSAVPVDGFIPPRAFQAFQARGILPIATDIRTSKHLAYTPAPDVIHEAAGHAPFLAEPHYGSFVRRFGTMAENAFTVPADRDLYEAIYTLSEVKENPASTPLQLTRAEQALERAARAMGPPSESAKLARLYWWTAEYGLVGTPTDFRLYGAGLLSSIGEGHSCFSPSVRKIPLSESCIDVDYDITRTQPQLFVARSLDELDDVLERVSERLAFRIGGDIAVEAALASGEPATLELDSGALVIGVVSKLHRHEGELALVELTGPCAVAENDAVLDALPRPPAYVLPLGPLEDGTPLSVAATSLSPSDGLKARFASGISVRGRVRARAATAGDRPAFLLVDDFEVTQGSRLLFRSAAPYPLALGQSITTARASLPTGFFPPTPISGVPVPRPRSFDGMQRELIGLYERGAEAFRQKLGTDVGLEVERIMSRIEAAFPEDWLLRWNLLEGLAKAGQRADLADRLAADLEQLEVRFDHLEPIATGLAYIHSLAGARRENRTSFV